MAECGQCKDCWWWEHIGDGYYCERVKRPASLARLVPEIYDYGVLHQEAETDLETAPDYGCYQFKPRPPTRHPACDGSVVAL